MTKDKALRQALEALEQDRTWLESWAPKEVWDKNKEASTAIKQALEQPEPEPVAWMWRCKPYCGWPEWSVSLNRPADSGRDGNKRTEGYEDIPLYTSPPASKPWVGLTDEEMHECWDSPLTPLGMKHARMIEAKLKEKNT